MRWHAVVTYLGEAGPVDVEHDFDELEDLHDLVERGPSWECITGIYITYAGGLITITLEEAART